MKIEIIRVKPFLIHITLKFKNLGEALFNRKSVDKKDIKPNKNA